MDEFNELDQELEKLRSELKLQDEWSRQFQAPAPGDYWRHRLDEEKALWQKKMQVSDEEKKALEERLANQQSQISAYNQKLNEIEHKFDIETRNWEERLKVKETELLMEKNRIMWEDKIRDAEYENKDLLQQIGTLNADIIKIKDENLAAAKKAEDDFMRERNSYHERIQTGTSSLQILQERIFDLEGRLSKRALEFEEIKQNHDAEIAGASESAKNLNGDIERLKRENRELEMEVTTARQKDVDDKIHLDREFKEITKSFVDAWRKSLGAIAGMAAFFSGRKPAPSAWNAFGEMLLDMEASTEMLAAQASLPSGYTDAYTAGIIAPDDDIAMWTKILAGRGVDLKSIGTKLWKKEIAALKPRVIIVSPKYRAYAEKAAKVWPFLPVVMYGDMKQSVRKKAAARGFNVIYSPSTDTETLNTLSAASLKSAARAEYWDKLKIRRSYPVLPMAAFILLAGIAALMLKTGPAGIPDMLSVRKTVSYATQYLQPTNVTYDGQNLWACDWFGQSIYKHKINGELGISRIFYFPNRHFSALAWMGGNLWSADAVDQKIYRHNPDDSLTINGTYDSPGPAPSGLAGNGRALWSCDASTAKIYMHNLDKTLSVEKEFAAPAGSPSGLYYDGEYLWSIDSKTNRVYKHAIDANLTVLETYLPPGYEQKGYNLSGITGNGKYFWVCSEKAGRIYQYPASLFAKGK